MSDTIPTRNRFQFSLVSLIVAVVFLSVCTGLWFRDEQLAKTSSLPLFCVALISLAPVLCLAFQTWVADWLWGLRNASSSQLVMSVLSAWGVAYGWTAGTVAVNAQHVGSLTPVLWLALLSAWFIGLCRAACAVYALTSLWTDLGSVLRLLLTSVVLLGLCFLFALALVGMIFVHLAAGGRL